MVYVQAPHIEKKEEEEEEEYWCQWQNLNKTENCYHINNQA